MKIQLESTTKIVHLDGVPARVWEGESEDGTPIHAFITRIAVREDTGQVNLAPFELELMKCRKPSRDVERLPDRLVL